MPRTYNEIDARVTRLMKELENLKKELAGKQGLLEAGDGIELTPDAQTNKITVLVDENVVALKEDFEANPTLAGTEPVLEGLKLLGTDYKVGGGGDLYQHKVTFTLNSNVANAYSQQTLFLYDTKSTAYTREEIVNKLGDWGSIFSGLVYAYATSTTTKHAIILRGYPAIFDNTLKFPCVVYELETDTVISKTNSNQALQITYESDTVTKL